MSRRLFYCLAVAVCLSLAGMGVPAAAQTCGPLDDGRLADVRYEGTVLQFEPIVEYREMVLTIQGPCEDVIRVFTAGEGISFDIREIERVTDGHYTWQLSRVAIDPALQEELQAARGTGKEDDIWWNFFQKGMIPEGPYVDSGSFTVERGLIIDPNSGEEKRAAVGAKAGIATAAASTLAGPVAAGSGDGAADNPLATKDYVINDDLIVIGSTCIGFDCVSGEVFSFDTIRLKENNLRIKFQDTSGGTFPTRDWEIEVNSSANGGQSHFRINDVDGARSPFTIEAASPSHSLYVDSSSRVGFGTSTPVLELHVKNGDSPGLRLEQDTSSGFAAQSWDIVGNETNFFVRDATNGSALPFRIQPGTASNTLFLDNEERVGVGTSSPAERLHVLFNVNENVLAAVENNNTGTAAAGVVRAKSDTATVNFQAHGSGRTLTRFGETLGGWGELLHASGNGLIVGTLGSQPLILGANNTNVLELTPTGQVLHLGGQVHPDYVFEPDFELESIEEHAAYMWEKKHLPAVGPGRYAEDGRAIYELGESRAGMLEELEKAHIYIDQLNQDLKEKDALISDLAERLARLESQAEPRQ